MASEQRKARLVTKEQSALLLAQVPALVRAYIANEISRELANGSTLAVRAVGEVLANMPGFHEAVANAAADVMRELLKP